MVHKRDTKARHFLKIMMGEGILNGHESLAIKHGLDVIWLVIIMQYASHPNIINLTYGNEVNRKRNTFALSTNILVSTFRHETLTSTIISGYIGCHNRYHSKTQPES
jgi:hypothetical protein